MPQFRRKPAAIEANQWFKNGDHPQDNSKELEQPSGPPRLSEGEVVKFFNLQHIPGDRFCVECGQLMRKHGLLLNPGAIGGEEIVHPGDWIVTNVKGGYTAYRPERFDVMFEPYEIYSTAQPTTTSPMTQWK